MQLIQFMPLIQFNVYYTLHSNTNNNRRSNNLLVIDSMLLIQFMVLIIGGFCYRDVRMQAAATAERRCTEARRAEDQGPQKPGSRPQGPTISGGATLIKLVHQNKLSRRRRHENGGAAGADRVQSCLWQSYFRGSNCPSHKLLSGSGWIIIGTRTYLSQTDRESVAHTIRWEHL